MLDFSRARLQPFQHQREDTEWLISHPFAFIASQMRTGKSKVVIDAAQFMFEAGTIERVIIVTPAPVRDVWADPVIGEIAKHAWSDLPSKIVEYHDRIRVWTNQTADNYMHWYITNFEFLRSKERLEQLLAACGKKTFLVGDESSFLKNHAAVQTRAFKELRDRCGRVVLLNGTPIYHSPLDIFSQANILSRRILDCPYITQFKARYAIQEPVLGFGGKPVTATIKGGKEIVIKRVTGWSNLDDIQRRLAPYTVRRLQADCLDLPPKLDPVTLTAKLDVSWIHYKNMRDEFVVWLTNSKVVMSKTAAIKALRLSQMTGGFLSGVEESGIAPVQKGLLDSLLLPGLEPNTYVTEEQADAYVEDVVQETVEIGREKLDVLLWLIEQQLAQDPNLKVVVWGRFRAEVFRAEKVVKEKFPQFETGLILGGQSKKERIRSLGLLHPDTAPSGPVFIAGIEGTGSFGLNMCASHTCVSMSGGYSPGKTAQTLDRVYGPGQKFPIAYYNIIATGPKGQKTIDHDILLARTSGEDLAQRTASAWVKALKEE